MNTSGPIGKRDFAHVESASLRHDIAAANEYVPLTMDTVLAYCAKRLRDMDTRIQNKMDDQNVYNSLSEDIGNIKATLKTDGKGGGNEVAFNDPDQIVNVSNALDAAIKKAEDSGNFKVADNLKDVKTKLLAGGDNKVGNDELESMNSILDHAASTCHTAAEAGLIEIQADMGKRANIIQVSTGLVNGINEGLKSVAGNIGR